MQNAKLEICFVVVLLVIGVDGSLFAHEGGVPAKWVQAPDRELSVRDSTETDVMPPLLSIDRSGEMPIRMIWEQPSPMGMPSMRLTPYEWKPAKVTAVSLAIPRNKYRFVSPGFVGTPGQVYVNPKAVENLNKVEIARQSWWPHTFMDR